MRHVWAVYRCRKDEYGRTIRHMYSSGPVPTHSVGQYVTDVLYQHPAITKPKDVWVEVERVA